MNAIKPSDQPLPDVPPTPATPQDALLNMVQLQHSEIMHLQALLKSAQEQQSDLGVMRHNVYLLTDEMNRSKGGWNRMRTYIAIGFWLFIGLPILFAVCALILALTGTLGSLLALWAGQ